MSETLGSCIGLISLGVAITVIVFTVRIYNDTKEANPLDFYDEILHPNKTNQLSFDGPPQDPVLNDLGKYCQCGEEILNNICSEEQIISGCYDVSKKDEKALIRRLSDLNCDSINKDLETKKYGEVFELNYGTVNSMALGILIIYCIILGMLFLSFVLGCGAICCPEQIMGILMLLSPIFFCLGLVIGVGDLVLHIILMVYYYKGRGTGEFLDYYNDNKCMTQNRMTDVVRKAYDKLDHIDSEMTAFVALNFIGIALNYLSSFCSNKKKEN